MRISDWSSDVCSSDLEYTSHRDYSFSATNNLISNLKKKPSQTDQPHYWYKGQAIGTCGRALGDALNPDWLANATLVPVPGSKAADHSEYEDRKSTGLNSRDSCASRMPPTA